MPKNRRCVIVFLKYPEAGTVKTRLCRVLNPAVVTGLYRCFVADTLFMLRRTGEPVRICYAPPTPEEQMIGWLGNQYELTPQKGEDLGQRMAHAFADAFSDGYHHVLLMGTDIPDLPPPVIDSAFRGLETAGVTIGPSRDGGYYLIGFTRDHFVPEVFQDMQWSTDTVFEETVSVLTSMGHSPHRLPEWNDIDEYADLKEMVETADPEAGPQETLAYLSRIKMP